MGFYGREYCLRHLYNLDPDYLKTVLDLKTLMSYEKDCQDAEKAIKEIRQEIADQVQQLQKVETKQFILVERVKPYQSNVQIIVKLHIEHKLGDTVRSDYKDYKKFTGLEKKQALAYAKELRQQYKLGIVRKNWR